MRFFFNNTLRSYDIAVGSLFSDIWVVQYDKDEREILNELKVPLTWAPKLHWYLRKHDTLPIDLNIHTFLPRISFQRKALQYDSKRQMNKYVLISDEKRYSDAVQNYIRRWVGSPVPYKIPYTFNIWAHNEIEMNQILEQVLGSFSTQTHNLFVNEVPLLNIGRYCKLSIDGISQNYQMEYDLKGDRILRHVLNLSLEGNIYPVIKEQSVIKEIITRFGEYGSVSSKDHIPTPELYLGEFITDVKDENGICFITDEEGLYIVSK